MLALISCSSKDDCKFALDEINKVGLIDKINDEFTIVKGTKKYDEFIKSSSRLNYSKKDQPFDIDTWEEDVSNLSIDSIAFNVTEELESIKIVYRFMSEPGLNVYPYVSISNDLLVVRCKTEREYYCFCDNGHINITSGNTKFCIQELTIEVPKRIFAEKGSLVFEPNGSITYFYQLSDLTK